MKRSRIGATDARPAYVALTLAMSSLPCFFEQLANTAPPTGTMKFLSVDCTKASRRPLAEHAAIAFMHAAHCTPYALFATCGTPAASQSRPSSNSLSTPRGAKHDVVEHAEHVLGAELVELRLQRGDVGAQLVAVEDVLDRDGVAPAAIALRQLF